MANTEDMWLVYRSESGDSYFQPWQDLTTAGTLIDPDSGEDMELVGWTTDLPFDF